MNLVSVSYPDWHVVFLSEADSIASSSFEIQHSVHSVHRYWPGEGSHALMFVVRDSLLLLALRLAASAGFAAGSVSASSGFAAGSASEFSAGFSAGSNSRRLGRPDEGNTYMFDARMPYARIVELSLGNAVVSRFWHGYVLVRRPRLCKGPLHGTYLVCGICSCTLTLSNLFSHGCCHVVHGAYYRLICLPF